MKAILEKETFIASPRKSGKQAKTSCPGNPGHQPKETPQGKRELERPRIERAGIMGCSSKQYYLKLAT